MSQCWFKKKNTRNTFHKLTFLSTWKAASILCSSMNWHTELFLQKHFSTLCYQKLSLVLGGLMGIINVKWINISVKPKVLAWIPGLVPWRPEGGKMVGHMARGSVTAGACQAPMTQLWNPCSYWNAHRKPKHLQEKLELKCLPKNSKWEMMWWALVLHPHGH